MDFPEEINYNEDMCKERKEDTGKTEEFTMYIIGWFLIGALLLIALGLWLMPQLSDNPRPCMFRMLTGFYCPGCGGTRAVLSLLHGRLIKSFMLHPFVLYVAVVGGWFMISQTIQRLSRGKLAIGMKYREIYLWLALGLVAANFLVKNILLLCGVDVLSIWR